MKKCIQGAVLVAMLGGLTSTAMAAEGAVSTVDARLGGMTYEIKGEGEKATIEGGTFDLRGWFEVTPNVFLRGEYLYSTSDELKISNDATYDTDTDTSVMRLGAGYQWDLGGANIYAGLEYGRVEIDNADLGKDKEDGFIVTGGFKDKGTGAFLWSVELGLVKLDDVDGATFDFALGYRFNPTFSILLGGQSYALQDDYDFDYTLATGTIGARFAF